MVAPLAVDAAAVAQAQCRARRAQRRGAAPALHARELRRDLRQQPDAALAAQQRHRRARADRRRADPRQPCGLCLRAARISVPAHAVRHRPARPCSPEPGGDPAAAPAVRLAAPAQQLSGPDPARPGRAVRRVLHDHLHARHPDGARRSGDARRRVALDDLLEDHRAADDPGAVDARGVHLPRRVERLLVAADQRDATATCTR